jgi:hypothetical protein
MSPEEFKAGLVSLYGADWRKRSPDAFGVQVTTVDRWVTAVGRPNHAVPHACAVKLLEHLLREEAERKVQRGYERTYKQKQAAKRRAHHGS